MRCPGEDDFSPIRIHARRQARGEAVVIGLEPFSRPKREFERWRFFAKGGCKPPFFHRGVQGWVDGEADGGILGLRLRKPLSMLRAAPARVAQR